MAAPRSGNSDPRNSPPNPVAQSAPRRARALPAKRLGRGSGQRRPLSSSAQAASLSASQSASQPASQSANQPASQPADPKPRSFRPQRPLWLALLLWTQRGSSVVTLVLGAAILVTYGWTVYIQQQWGRDFDRLEAMKKQERQLISTNEVLKNQMAEQAEKPTAGLLLPDPSNAIFLTPAPQRPDVKVSPRPPVAVDSARPLGY